MRGGGWADAAGLCRAAFRNFFAPNLHNTNVGFRVAFDVEMIKPTTEVTKNDPNPRRSYMNRSGQWKIEGTELVQESLESNAWCQLVFGDFTWKDYDFTFEAKRVQKQTQEEIGLLYHVSGAGWCSISTAKRGELRNYVTAQSFGRGATGQDNRGQFNVEMDSWYKVRVSLRGTHCQFFLNEEKIIDYENKQNPQGAVGVWTKGAAVHFRNIRVTDPAGKVLFEGLPALPVGPADQWPPATEPASESELHCLKGHLAPVTGVVFSRDGRQVVSCNSMDLGSIRLWDGETGKNLSRSEIIQPVYAGLTFSKLAAVQEKPFYLTSCSRKQQMQLWQVEKDKLLPPTVFPGKILDVLDLGITPDGRKVRVLGRSGTIWEWSFPDKKFNHQLAADLKGVVCGALSPDGRFALLARNNQPLTEIDLDSGKETDRWKDVVDSPTSLAIAPDGSRVLVGTKLGGIQLWDVASGKALPTFAGHQGPVRVVAFSPDGRYALSGSDDQTVRFWDLAGKKQLNCFNGHTGPVISVAFSPDGSRAASGSDDYTVRLWRLR